MVQNNPDQPAKTGGQWRQWLVQIQAAEPSALHNFEDASFDLYRGVGSLIENAPVALRGSMAVGYSRALFVSGAYSHQEERFFWEGKVAALGRRGGFRNADLSASDWVVWSGARVECWQRVVAGLAFRAGPPEQSGLVDT